MRPANVLLLFVGATASLASACEGEGYDVVVRFAPESLADEASGVEVAVVASCEEAPSDGTRPADVIRRVVVDRSGSAEALGRLAAGSYGIHALARSGETCEVVAVGCTDVRLEAGGHGTLEVVLGPVAGPGCGPGLECEGGACVGVRCLSAEDCDDGLFCNGAETCEPGAEGANEVGCLSATSGPCRADQGCDEAEAVCFLACSDACVLGCDGERCAAVDAEAVSAGGAHGCAIDRSGPLLCWGANGSGQLGDGSTEDSATPVVVSGLDHVRAISLGDEHGCVLLAGGEVACWGRGSSGQIGDGGSASRAEPTSVPGVADAVSVAAGGRHSCAALASGHVLCWGANDEGQLGIGNRSDRPDPTEVRDVTTAVAVAVGEAHSCALLEGGAVVCWGANAGGQLGDGTTTRATAPVDVAGLADAVEVAAGGEGTCARTADGAVLCWGCDDQGQLGDGPGSAETACACGTGSACSRTPVEVSGLAAADGLAVGSGHGCAALSGSGVECWGRGGRGAIGDGELEDRDAPARAAGVGSVQSVAAGEDWSCAATDEGAVLCWGANDRGQLGDGTTADRPTPSRLAGD